MKNTKLFNSISRVAAVLMVLCIIPSGAFTSENKPAFAPAENITDENYVDVQADLLDSLSENQNSSNQAKNFCLQAVLFLPSMFYINNLSEHINSCNHYIAVN